MLKLLTEFGVMYKLISCQGLDALTQLVGFGPQCGIVKPHLGNTKQLESGFFKLAGVWRSALGEQHCLRLAPATIGSHHMKTNAAKSLLKFLL